MNEMTPRKLGGSLIERAAALYDFDAQLRMPAAAPLAPEAAVPIAPVASDPAPEPAPAPEAEALVVPEAAPVAEAAADPVPPASAAAEPVDAAYQAIVDRTLLSANGLLVPGAPVGVLAEEFRLIKRQLVATARAIAKRDEKLARIALVCSARPDDGKTFCALNLAISLAAERDLEVLLIDADFAKPDVMTRLGLREGQGLLDALADPSVDVERFVVATDIPHLSLLPAGTKSNDDTELLASARTGAVIGRLLAANPRRLLIFDSPPALAASPASVLAGHVGQVMLVVRADRTTENDLREAVALLDGCEDIQLVLNAVSFASGSRRFGSYYEQETPK